jgi:hypothetical protein
MKRRAFIQTACPAGAVTLIDGSELFGRDQTSEREKGFQSLPADAELSVVHRGTGGGITAAVVAGVNQLELDVTNTWVNRLIGDSGKPQEKRVTYGGTGVGLGVSAQRVRCWLPVLSALCASPWK